MSKKAETLTLAFCIALLPPIWAVAAPYFNITTGAVALICAGLCAANGDRTSDALKISVGFLLGDIWAWLALFIMQRPELGNGGLYSFAYVYLTGNPVYGVSLEKRVLLALVGYAICGLILWAKHRHAHGDVRFHHLILKFDVKNPVILWQLRMAVGVSLILTAGQVSSIWSTEIYVDGLCLCFAFI